LLALGTQTKADRIVLSPGGETLPENSFKTEAAFASASLQNNLSWFTYSSADGIELEFERQQMVMETKPLYAFNLEYPLPTFRNLPALSLGIRDMLGTGTEHGAFYLAISKPLALSARQRRLVRDIRLNAGAGTGRIGGLFVGLETRLAAGLSLNAELYRRRPNFGVALPLTRHLQARAYSLDGDLFYGLSLNWSSR